MDGDDIITVDEVAKLLKKSTSWCYSNAAALGASKISGSVIFQRSALISSLEEAKMKKPDTQRNEKTGSSRPVARKDRKPQKPTYTDTDPAAHGLFNFRVIAASADPKDTFDGIDLTEALDRLRL